MNLLRNSRRLVIDEYIRLMEELGEPSVEEVEEATREASWAKLEKARQHSDRTRMID